MRPRSAFFSRLALRVIRAARCLCVSAHRDADVWRAAVALDVLQMTDELEDAKVEAK